jgi:hypothetical protein
MLNLTNFHWFSVVWTLIYHDLRHHMVKMLWTHEAQLSKPVEICFLQQQQLKIVDWKGLERCALAVSE